MMKNDLTALIVFAVVALVIVGVGTKLLGLAGFAVLGIGVVIGIVFLLKSLKSKSDPMKISGVAIMVISLASAIGVRHYTVSRTDESATSSNSYVAGYSDDETPSYSDRERTLDGMDSDSQRRYDSLNSDGQAYVDEQMRQYDELCSRSSRC